MRRALRHLFTILSALSLLLCVAMCALWVRSTMTSDYLARAAGGRCVTVDISSDSLYITQFTGWPIDEPLCWRHGAEPLGATLHWEQNLSPYVRVSLDESGRSVNVYTHTGPTHESGRMTAQAVYWLRFSNWTALSAILPIVWASNGARGYLLRRKRRKAGC